MLSYMNNSFNSCLRKQQHVISLFTKTDSAEQKYKKIIELGTLLPSYPQEKKTPENTVDGCQSTLYLYTTYEKGLLHFYAHSDALISSGLAHLMLLAYNDEPPEAILKCPPQFLSVLHIPEALSLSRSNGLSSLWLKMQQKALFHIYWSLD